ncbi:MAG: hypothetical protein CMQ20_14585 [Gammaproteobacteria bacterium]|jgi:hypothetical protein|nr:hypothetical protein [Gammaproteobacteria bacterium]
MSSRIRELLTALLCLLAAGNVEALTVAEVAEDLACPCQCPLILQDCNMSCGLTWKNEIGELINKGMTKQKIMDYFISTHGDSARLTTRQKLEGKIYQYTRSFGTLDWVMLWSGISTWIAILFTGIYLGVGRFLPALRNFSGGEDG